MLLLLYQIPGAKRMRNLIQNKNLDGADFVLEGKKDCCIVLVHGFTATTIEVRPLGEYLASKGYYIDAPLLPGHNTHPDDLNKQKWMEWTNKVESVTKNALDKYKNVFLGGESMGGLISCYIASNHPELAGLLLYSPAIRVKNLELMYLLQFFKKYIGKPSLNVEDKDIHDVLPWKGYKVNPTRAAVQLLRLQKVVESKLPSIFQPAIIFQGKLDKTIDQTGASIVYTKINSKIKKLIWLDESNHCVLLDKEYSFVFSESQKFIEFVLSQKQKLSTESLGYN